METGQIIEMEKIGCREFNANETILQLSRLNQLAYRKFICWGAKNFVVDSNNNGLSKVLRFKVNGMKHKGFVYISLNFMDTYDIYFTNSKGVIKSKQTDIYFDQLNEVIDNTIEKQDNYKF